MDWHPNEDAVRYFIADILPLIRNEIPDVTFSVVGRNPSDDLRAIGAADGVDVTGTLDDIRPALAAATVCVVPLRAGSGTRLKIFEALAMGKAVVSTTLGAEGLTMESGRHFVAAGSAADGTSLSDLDLGEDAWVSMIGREGYLVDIDGETRLEAGDEVLLIGRGSRAVAALFESP